MGPSPIRTLFQRRHTDGQQTHEKMLNITNYWRKTNQNYNELSSHAGLNGYHQTIKIGEGVENIEPTYAADGNIN